MGILKNLPFVANMGLKKPQDIINILVSRNPQLKQAYQIMQRTANGDTENIKKMVLEQASGMDETTFNQFSEFARSIGMDEQVLDTIKQSIK